MNEDLRICFIGDSFVQGIGDPEYRGWVGRVLAASGPGITAFNLGIRRNTSADVLRRCWGEIEPRVLPGADNRLVISFGSNDAVVEDGNVRVGRAQCLDNLATLLTESRERAIHPLVIGPPPVIDGGAEHLRRTAELADDMAELCESRKVPFVATTQHLADDPVWTREARAGDGAHPGSGGYQRLAELVLDSRWQSWIARPTPYGLLQQAETGQVADIFGDEIRR
ncbi:MULTISPECIES: GDSL-type esterase/lipase family protein [unclassified Nocardia]|uniref:GDSL-type esterase/lipase family protein n=1 Tax=Nocardia sp. NPDC058114 TaxID=3346346 RepID=UPI0036D85CF5